MLDFVVHYWFEVLFGLIVSALGFGYRKLARKIDESKAVKLGVQALLRDRLIQAYHFYTKEGCWPISARDNYTSMYEAYVANDGNGVVPSLFEQLKLLPLECEEENE